MKYFSDNSEKPFLISNNLKHFEERQVRSKVECDVICKQTFECVSFTFEIPRKCLLYNHAKGNYRVKN